jgi:FkbM family methyltransferase
MKMQSESPRVREKTGRQLRPFPLRTLPPTLRQIVWSRFYRSAPQQLLGLFNSAPLHFAPSVVMTGLVPGDVISDAIALTGIYDLPMTRWLLKIAREERGLFVDVGANLGYFSLLWAAQDAQNRAIAIEASPRIVGLLEENVRDNRLGDRITVRAQAAGARRGTMQFNSGPAEQTGWGGFAPATSSATATVDVVPLDELLSEIQDIAILMVDVQGADFWALQGAERLLRERRAQHIIWEENKERMQQLSIPPGESQKFMQMLGYTPMPHGDPAAGVLHWSARS